VQTVKQYPHLPNLLAPHPAGGGKDTTPAIGGQGTARKGSGDVAAVEGANANASANDAESRSVNGKATSRAQMLMMAVETMGGNVHAMSVESGLGVYVGNVGAERAQRSVHARA
jgi:hypothetical protein